MGFYLLRIALWNTYGKEIITFNNDIIDYIADYGWFKDSKKQIAVKERLDYGIMPIGYEEDHEGTLIISLEELNIVCVTKMPISEIEKLIEKLHVMDEIPNIVNVWNLTLRQLFKKTENLMKNNPIQMVSIEY